VCLEDSSSYKRVIELVRDKEAGPGWACANLWLDGGQEGHGRVSGSTLTNMSNLKSVPEYQGKSPSHNSRRLASALNNKTMKI